MSDALQEMQDFVHGEGKPDYIGCPRCAGNECPHPEQCNADVRCACEDCPCVVGFPPVPEPDSIEARAEAIRAQLNQDLKKVDTQATEHQRQLDYLRGVRYRLEGAIACLDDLFRK